MDKTSKKVLYHIRHRDNPEKYMLWFLDNYVSREAESCGVTPDEFLNAIKHLIDEGLVEYIPSKGKLTGIKLTHKGVHYNEFARQKIREYIVDKWIDIIALVVAVAAFIQSCIALAS